MSDGEGSPETGTLPAVTKHAHFTHLSFWDQHTCRMGSVSITQGTETQNEIGVRALWRVAGGNKRVIQVVEWLSPLQRKNKNSY